MASRAMSTAASAATSAAASAATSLSANGPKLAAAATSAASCPEWARDVLHFWFTKFGPTEWFKGGEPVDKLCREHYLPLYERLAASPIPPPSHPSTSLSSLDCSTPAECLANPEAALAGIIVYDQFPRNMFRKTARAFATDPHALALAKYSVAKGFDKGMDSVQKMFLYMPYMHSEDLADADAGMELFRNCEGPYHDKLVEFGEEHRDMIRRFGRYPHRNAVLGRQSTEEEIELMKEHQGYGQ